MVVLVLAHAQYPCYTRDLREDSPSFGVNLHCNRAECHCLMDIFTFVCPLIVQSKSKLLRKLLNYASVGLNCLKNQRKKCKKKKIEIKIFRECLNTATVVIYLLKSFLQKELKAAGI